MPDTPLEATIPAALGSPRRCQGRVGDTRARGMQGAAGPGCPALPRPTVHLKPGLGSRFRLSRRFPPPRVPLSPGNKHLCPLPPPPPRAPSPGDPPPLPDPPPPALDERAGTTTATTGPAAPGPSRHPSRSPRAGNRPRFPRPAPGGAGARRRGGCSRLRVHLKHGFAAQIRHQFSFRIISSSKKAPLKIKGTGARERKATKHKQEPAAPHRCLEPKKAAPGPGGSG